MTGVSGKSEVMFSNMWQAHPRNRQMMVRSYISKEGATKEGDGGTRQKPDVARAYVKLGKFPEMGPQPRPAEHSNRGHITGKMKQAAKKYS